MFRFPVSNRIRETLRDILHAFPRLPVCAWQRLFCQFLTRLGPVICQDCVHIIFRTTRFTLKINKESGQCDVLEIDGARLCDGAMDHEPQNFIRSTTDEPRFKFVNFRDRGNQRLTSVTYEPASSVAGTLVYRWEADGESAEIRVKCVAHDKHIEYALERIATSPPGVDDQIEHVEIANLQLRGAHANSRTGTVITDEVTACPPAGSARRYRISEFALTLPTNITVSQEDAVGHPNDWELAASADKSVLLCDPECVNEMRQLVYKISVDWLCI